MPGSTVISCSDATGASVGSRPRASVDGDAAGAFNLGLAFAVLVAARLANLPRLRPGGDRRAGEALGLYGAETLPRHEAGMLIAVFALGLAVGALWEIFEWSSDGLFGSELSEGNTDTVGDLIADACGSLLGGALMVLWAKKGWGSVRRIPGENRREQVHA
jgi:hypothetical protein